jgi:hypothetical protein
MFKPETCQELKVDPRFFEEENYKPTKKLKFWDHAYIVFWIAAQFYLLLAHPGLGALYLAYFTQTILTKKGILWEIYK